MFQGSLGFPGFPGANGEKGARVRLTIQLLSWTYKLELSSISNIFRLINVLEVFDFCFVFFLQVPD